MASTSVPDDDCPGNLDGFSLFQKAAGCGWADIGLFIDSDLPAIVLQIAFDEKRFTEVLLSPDAALDLSLKVVGAVQRLREHGGVGRSVYSSSHRVVRGVGHAKGSESAS
jgi:hypothetical protein